MSIFEKAFEKVGKNTGEGQSDSLFAADDELLNIPESLDDECVESSLVDDPDSDSRRDKMLSRIKDIYDPYDDLISVIDRLTKRQIQRHQSNMTSLEKSTTNTVTALLGAGIINSLVGIREELMRGDYRALFLGWLADFNPDEFLTCRD